MKFVEIAKRKLETATSSTRTTYAVVQAEDVANLKDEFFDVIVMRSVLHHVTDFDAFVDLLMTKLTPNGAILFLEPGRSPSSGWAR
jgi:2-polyprenyl-3-methyl-5-hydroxy-6-metoxy-1,4-benzoquinol methylase